MNELVENSGHQSPIIFILGPYKRNNQRSIYLTTYRKLFLPAYAIRWALFITNNHPHMKDGKRYESPFTMYCYNYTDLEGFVKSTNLEIMEVRGGWKGEAFDMDSRRIILTLKKTEN